jgi:predicted DNA binding CopG/RHH family protein
MEIEPMTITKKPSRPKKVEEKRDAIATAFIQAAEQRALTETTPPAVEKTAKIKKSAAKKVEADAVTETKTPETKEKKSKEKGKKKKNKKKEAVIIRFENDQLAGIDAKADALGLSRAAWVRMVVSQALAKS